MGPMVPDVHTSIDMAAPILRTYISFGFNLDSMIDCSKAVVVDKTEHPISTYGVVFTQYRLKLNENL